MTAAPPAPQTSASLPADAGTMPTWLQPGTGAHSNLEPGTRHVAAGPGATASMPPAPDPMQVVYPGVPGGHAPQQGVHPAVHGGGMQVAMPQFAAVPAPWLAQPAMAGSAPVASLQRRQVSAASNRRDGAFSLTVGLFLLAIVFTAYVALEAGAERKPHPAPAPAAAVAAPQPAAAPAAAATGASTTTVTAAGAG